MVDPNETSLVASQLMSSIRELGFSVSYTRGWLVVLKGADEVISQQVLGISHVTRILEYFLNNLNNAYPLN